VLLLLGSILWLLAVVHLAINLAWLDMNLLHVSLSELAFLFLLDKIAWTAATSAKAIGAT
jgi:hypothetical protein